MKLNHFLIVLAMAFSVCTISCEKDIAGCMDPTSANFNADANVDSGDCEYRGCTDSTSETYDAKATIDDGSCEYKGCTDENSLTYDAKATIDDGSCTYARDAFIGSFAATETCTSNTGTSGNFSWTMTIIAATGNDLSQVTISNFGNYSKTFNATVEDDKLTVDYTDSGSGLSIVGSGTLTGNELTLMYTASVGPSSETCIGTATKQ